jgi:hypothetical protein
MLDNMCYSLRDAFVELVLTAMYGDDLLARQWVKDARREHLDLSRLPPPPRPLNVNERATYAGLAELLTGYFGQTAPGWTSSVGAADQAIYLDSDAAKSEKLRAHLEKSAPEPLRRRRVFAAHDYLNVL